MRFMRLPTPQNQTTPHNPCDHAMAPGVCIEASGQLFGQRALPDRASGERAGEIRGLEIAGARMQGEED